MTLDEVLNIDSQAYGKVKCTYAIISDKENTPIFSFQGDRGIEYFCTYDKAKHAQQGSRVQVQLTPACMGVLEAYANMLLTNYSVYKLIVSGKYKFTNPGLAKLFSLGSIDKTKRKFKLNTTYFWVKRDAVEWLPVNVQFVVHDDGNGGTTVVPATKVETFDKKSKLAIAAAAILALLNS